MNERLRFFIENEGLSVRQFESLIGSSDGKIAKFIASNSSLKSDTLIKVMEIFPHLSINWLLTGEGEMLLSSSDKHEGTTKELQRNYEETTDLSKAGIPLIPVDAVAGFNGIDSPSIHIDDCQRYLVPEFKQLNAEFMIRVSGSSMYPKYSSGDILACRKLTSYNFIQWGKIYVIDSEQGAMVKRLFPCDEQPDCVTCKSDNPNYPPFKLPTTEIRSLSIVLGSIRFE